MEIATRTLYQSANGDRWQLARERATNRLFVRHEANPASGGRLSDIELAAFLGTSGAGPEKQELLRLIATLVDEPSTAVTGAAEAG